MNIFFMNSKKHIYIFTDHLNKVRGKWKNAIKCDIVKKDIECKIQNKKTKAKNERYRNIKTKTQKEKKVVSQKNRLKMWTCINSC